MNQFYIGSSYYPEWWDESQWEEDFAKMEELGFNIVRMGEFAWSWYEPTEGNYNFEPMRRALDCAHKHGIRVVMCTTTAVAPPWLYKKHPEIKGGNAYGHYDFGGRKGQCLSSEVFLGYAEKITARQTEALGNHPAVVGWQLDNEPGFPFWDFDDNCKRGFQQWLREKYGSIEALNKAWFGMLWSNQYTDFDEIHIPVNVSEGGWSPQVQLDYRRYFSFTFHRLLSMESAYVRKNSPKRWIYTNWPGANWSVNCFDGERYLDYAGWDNYVPQPFSDEYRIQLRASMEHSFDRRLSNGDNRFLVAEQKAYVDADINPDVIAAQTWLNVSHGAFGTIFFEWRMPTGSFEQAYDSVLGRDKNYRPETKAVFQRLCKDINSVYPLISNAKTESRVAVLYSYENSWAMRGWVVDGLYDEEFFNAYGGFKNALKTNVDVVGIQDDFSQYEVLVVPNHRLTTLDEARKIKAFVQAGGTVVMNTDCGTRDENNQTRELLPPGLFADLCGCFASGHVSAADLKKHTGESAVCFADGSKFELTADIDVLTLNGAEQIATYTSGRLAGMSAITCHTYGKGKAYLYGFNGCDVYFYEKLAATVTNIVPLMQAGDGVLLSSRTADSKEYIFAVNMKDADVTVHPQSGMYDVLKNQPASDSVTLRPYETRIFKKS